MILFTLKCSHDHRFEAWFKDGAAYDRQAAKGVIACAECGDTRIEKAPMAPAIGNARNSDKAVEARAAVMDLLREARRQVETNCDYVGENFAEEARKIHYGEVDPHAIYGEASSEDAEALVEEGIEVARIPWVPLEN